MEEEAKTVAREEKTEDAASLCLCPKNLVEGRTVIMEEEGKEK